MAFPYWLQRPLSPDLSPNVQAQDLWFALWHLVNPLLWFRWTRGRYLFKLEERFKQLFSVGFAYLFDSGRTALLAILESLDLQEDDEVFLQALTCVVVPNTVLAIRAVPVYVDIDKTYNMDPVDLEQKIQKSRHPKAVIVQHTFGQPADMNIIQNICRRYHLRLIEDCAHSLGARVDGQLVGSFGDAAMFSFGRDKIISSVSGGAVITHDPKIAEHLHRFAKAVSFPSLSWIAQRLFHPLLFAVAKRCYYLFSFGQLLIHGAKFLHLTPLVVESSEKQGHQPPSYRLPNVLAHWAFQQLDQLDFFNRHRQEIADFYRKELSAIPSLLLPFEREGSTSVYLRYTITVDAPEWLSSQLRRRGVMLGNWYRTVVAPLDVSFDVVGYTKGSCPRAEEAAERVVNLPTNITMSMDDVERVVRLLKHAVQI